MTTTLAPATSEPAAPVAWEPCADAVWSDLDGGCCATCGWPLDEHPGRDGAPTRAA